MKIISIIAENWKADGGAAFGVVPKTIWGKLYPADDDNLQKITSRCLLVDTGSRVILFDTGMGNKQDEKFFRYRYRFGDDSLFENLKYAGYSADDITDAVFTHLHFDHCGGASCWNSEGSKVVRVFPNATYHVSKAQAQWALYPNKREAASYLKENLEPIFEAGPLNLIEKPGPFIQQIDLRFYNGHTSGQIIPFIHLNNQTVVFVSDFIPSSAHLPLVYIPAYDIQPLITLTEKEEFLHEAIEKQYILVFGHDYFNEAATVIIKGKGFQAEKIGKLSEFI
ncbi:MAG TPA: MBL fold metallo-hydrolase [Bacteroidales bacterium]|nr:MBL fold metallo-hydrolase [Bacteroidales bacterium]MDI9574485.1 MBL fold metallo-hydrolase [Bacteroidota bacterium]MBP9511496.1 MBL fold metallo-hydrolase [Bacteroidales bacterium]MBP9588224.1 MBL fold metallo-hydrolase [Bacteroidales bacterium]NMD16765.1 MBL fold metallo-hydrolase [Bacteroidales bacterium]